MEKFAFLGEQNANAWHDGVQVRPMVSGWTSAAAREEDNEPAPPECTIYVLPLALRERLSAHVITKGLHLCSAGFLPNDTRRYVCGPLKNHLMYFCVGGEMTVHVKHVSRKVSAGDLVLIPAGTPHVTEASPQSPLTFYFAGFAGALCQDYLDLFRDPLNHVGMNPDFIKAFVELVDLKNSDFSPEELMAASMKLASLITSFSAALHKKVQLTEDRINLKKLRSYMADHLNRDMTLDELAELENLSPHYFSRKFKTLTGMPPIAYFIQMRIQSACHLLSHSAQPIKQIADMVGYDDPLYFAKTFRRVMGVTPSAYRAGCHRE